MNHVRYLIYWLVLYVQTLNGIAQYSKNHIAGLVGGGGINSYKVTKTADEYDNQNAEKHIFKVMVFKTQLGPLRETS